MKTQISGKGKSVCVQVSLRIRKRLVNRVGLGEGASSLLVQTLQCGPDKDPTPAPQIAHPPPHQRGRGRGCGTARAHCLLQHRGQSLRLRRRRASPPPQHQRLADVTLQPSPNPPSWPPWSRPYCRESSRTAPREVQDRGVRVRPYALRRQSLGAASVCSGQQRSRVVPESAALLLSPSRSAPAAHRPTAPRIPCPKPPP